jgi:hypothetical protein
MDAKILTLLLGAAGIGLSPACNVDGTSDGVEATSSSNAASHKRTRALVTTPQPINGTDQFNVLTWDLGAQLPSASGIPLPGTVGASFSISVRTVTLGNGAMAYVFNDPGATAGSTTALEFRGVNIIINEEPVAQTIYTNIDRFVPAANSRTFSPTAQLVNVTPAPGDVVSIAFGAIAPATFNPPTYQGLLASTGAFGAHCVACHSGATPAAGMDITNWAFLIANAEAIPYDPANSFISQRILNSIGLGIMPRVTNGLQNPADIQAIQDWIRDGAPNN